MEEKVPDPPKLEKDIEKAREDYIRLVEEGRCRAVEKMRRSGIITSEHLAFRPNATIR